MYQSLFTNVLVEHAYTKNTQAEKNQHEVKKIKQLFCSLICIYVTHGKIATTGCISRNLYCYYHVTACCFNLFFSLFFLLYTPGTI